MSSKVTEKIDKADKKSKKTHIIKIREYDEKNIFKGMKYMFHKKTKTKFVLDSESNLIIGKEMEGSLIKLTDDDFKIAKRIGKVYEENKVCSVIYKLFNTFMTKSFEGRLIYMFHQSSPKNIHNLRLNGLSVLYHEEKYHTDFFIDLMPDGMYDEDINYDNDSRAHVCHKNLFFSLIKAFDLINDFIFCIHCGKVVVCHYYDEEEGKCMGCQIQDSLFERKQCSELCAICQEQVKNVYKLKKCGHVFHRGCVSQLNPKKCPICRKYVDPEIDDDIFNEIEEEEEEFDANFEENAVTTI